MRSRRHANPLLWGAMAGTLTFMSYLGTIPRSAHNGSALLLLGGTKFAVNTTQSSIIKLNHLSTDDVRNEVQCYEHL
jgi:hypothetical protein